MRVVGVRGLAKGDVVWVPGWQVTGAAPLALSVSALLVLESMHMLLVGARPTHASECLLVSGQADLEG